LKESNILISFDKQNEGNVLTANLPVIFKIADLGIAKDVKELGGPKNLLLTSGTPKYMAPEQFVSKRGQVADPFKCETYSLGIILFHLIFKEYPF